MISQIENFVRQQRAGMLDLNSIEYDEWLLIEIWHDAETEHERNFKIYTKALFEALTKAR